MITLLGTLMALGFVGIGATLVAMAIRKLLRDSILARRGAVAEGRIVAVKEGYDEEWAEIAFADGRGEAHQFRSDFGRPLGTSRVGDAVAVRYDPANLSRAHEVCKRGHRAVYYTFLVVGGVVGVYGGLMMLYPGLALD